MSLHAHVSTESRDCDSTYSRSYILRPTAEEDENTFGDIDFHERALLSVVSIYACTQGTLKVDESGLEWSESTEEGYRYATVEWCHLDCSDDSTYRDSTAERAGY